MTTRVATPIQVTRLRHRVRLPLPQPEPLMLVALVALLFLVVAAFFGERLAPNEPIYFVVEHGADPRPYDPGIVFPLGSDVLGRDLFSLVLAGARATLTLVLLAGFARVAAGVLVAASGSLWRPARVLIDGLADFVGAVPATLVALVLVKAFANNDTSVLVLIGALLLVGWAGPYRVIRAEVDRLAVAPFTESARAMGVSRSRLFWRHQFPHLVPVLAINLSQQVVASLVLIAELGVLGVFVGTVRAINIAESLSIVRTGPLQGAAIPDIPEWGALLATSRSTEALWVTRWLIFVPGAAFALTAIAIAAIGFALARRYARRDLFGDLRGAGILAFAIGLLFVGSSLVPERYAAAREWAATARAGARPAPDPTDPFSTAGLRTLSAVRQVTTVARTGPTTVTLGSASIEEPYPPVAGASNATQIRPLVAGGLGGTVTAPLVFAARGIVPTELRINTFQRRSQQKTGGGPDLGVLVQSYPDDYAGIDVRGKVVLVVRFLGVDAREAGYAQGPAVNASINGAVSRGAAAVLFVDPSLGGYKPANDPYLVMEHDSPPTSTSGVPVVVLDAAAARMLTAPLNLDLTPFLGWDVIGQTFDRSAARDLGTSARVAVPLRAETSAVESRVAEVADVPADAGRIVVWAARRMDRTELEPARAEVLASLARLGSARHAPFIFVDFDPHADTRAVRDALNDRRILLVIVLNDLGGDTLQFKTANGDLIPAFDQYAKAAGARYEVTRRTALAEQVNMPLFGAKTMEISTVGTGGAGPDVTALIGYLAGRLELGAPELR